MNNQWFQVEKSDCLEWLGRQPDDSIDLVFGSPPYEAQRNYGINFALKGQDWVDWMVAVVRAALRACKGLVAFVVEGCTRSYCWSATPALLMADLHRAGIALRKPPIYQRYGIPGSGGKDWLRNDYEFVVCATNHGPLPWSDNVAMGTAPKYAPGGLMSNRQKEGRRKNDRHRAYARNRRKGGEREYRSYNPPEKSNPGNVIDCGAVGKNIGGTLAHENEAPFPEQLAEFFIRSFCPEGGVVADCFSGSGTTGAVAVRHHRRFAGCDVRQSQVDLSVKRISGEIGMFHLG